MNAQPVCPGRRTVGGQDLACTEPPGHRGPHSAPGTPPLVGAAWCDAPCRGRRCAGPCHPDDPGPEHIVTRSDKRGAQQ